MTMRKVSAVVVLALLLAACTGGDDVRRAGEGIAGQGGVVAAAAASLVSFDACGDLLGYVTDVAADQVGPYGLQGGGMVVEDGAAMESLDGADDTAAAPQAAPEPSARTADADGGFSTTNVQEAGVDEPDTVKTDGQLLVAAASVPRAADGGDPFAPSPTLQVLDVGGAEPRLLADLPLEGWDPQLLLSGSRVLVVSRTSWEDAPADARPEPLPPERQHAEVTRVDTVSLDDPAAPAVVATRLVEGGFVNARLVDGVVRLVTRSTPGGIAWTYPESGDQAAVERAEAANREAVAQSTEEDWLPQATALDADGGVVDRGMLLECSDVARPAEPHGLGVLSVQTLDAATGEPAGPATAVIAEGDTVYASRDTLYVALTTGGWAGRPVPMPMPVDPMPMPEPAPMPVEPDAGDGAGAPPQSGAAEPAAPAPAPQADPAPDAPAAREEPAAPTVDTGDEPVADDIVVAEPQPAEPPDVDPATPRSVGPPPEVTTEIHAFDITDPRTATYVASGEVDGTLLNQFSMSEHDGHLRVATTLPFGDDGDGTSESAVTVMARDGDRLARVGRVAGLGRTERIYAVRFLGPVGYVVTFRETDPLYTVDLSDPADPRVVGELKIPGYSAYLHPVDDGLLLGIGQDATDTGARLGTQASLFDVGDLAAPERLAAVTLGEGAETEAEYDHHAFLWWPDADLAVLPVTDWSASGGQPESAAVALRVDPAGALTEVGRVSHPATEAGGATDELRMPMPEVTRIRRSLIVDGRLLTVSDAGVKVSDLDSLADVAWLPF